MKQHRVREKRNTIGVICALISAVVKTATVLLVLTLDASANLDSSVKTPDGEIRGIVRGDVREFLGIPYAAPPVGAQRWQPPMPHASWSGILDASRAGSSCVQTPFRHSGIEGSEDCLYLNVYTPNSGGRDLPVMVWIHGGTFIAGAGAWYPAKKLAAKGNLIVVTINYRLGAFGFLASRSLDATDPRRISGNYGLLDQQAALRWVKDNIAAFGGDPNKVTVAGQSSGAISIGLHLVSPAAKGLFARAIIESGPFLGPLHHTPTLAEAEVRGDEFTIRLGCDKASNVADAAACLRSMTAAEVLNAIPANLIEAGPLPWSPAVDGHLIPSQPADAISAGRFHKVPVINGSNRDEGTLFTAFDKPLSRESYEQSVKARAGNQAARILAEYPASSYASPAQAAAAAVGDYTFSCRIVKASELMAPMVPVYQYEFDDRRAPNASYANPRFPLGAYHGAEIQYLFGSLATDRSLTPAQHQLSDAMMDYWIGFIVSGNPGGSPPWIPFHANDPRVLSLAPSAIGYETNFVKAHHCDLWDSISQ